MPLTANRDVDHYVDQELRTFPVAAAKHVYKGALVGTDSAGYARPLAAGDSFAGIAYEEMDNSAGASGAFSREFVLPYADGLDTLLDVAIGPAKNFYASDRPGR